MVRTRMPGGVGGKAREGLPIPIDRYDRVNRKYVKIAGLAAVWMLAAIVSYARGVGAREALIRRIE